MSGDVARVGNDDVVADEHVVREVAIGHQQAIRTHLCDHAILGTAIDCDALPNDGSIPNLDGGCFAREFQILWHGADDGTGKYLARITQRGVAVDDRVWANPAVCANDCVALNEGKRLNHRPGTDGGIG